MSENERRRRTHRRREDALERVREDAGGHRRPSEKRASLRIVNVYIRPPWRPRVRLGELRLKRGHAGGGWSGSPEGAARSCEETISFRRATERRVDRREPAGHGRDPKRPAFLDPARTPGCGEEECCANNQPCEGQGPAHCVRDGTRPTVAGKGLKLRLRAELPHRTTTGSRPKAAPLDPVSACASGGSVKNSPPDLPDGVRVDQGA